MNGQDAYSVFSSDAIIAAIDSSRDSLGISSDVDALELPKVLSGKLMSTNESERGIAEKIAREFGCRLGAILFAMKTASPELREANSRYAPDDWTPWTSAENVILSGGLASGNLGKALRNAAVETMYCLGQEISIEISSHPAFAPLIGVSRLVPINTERAVVFDFGHTFVKSAISVYNGNNLEKIVLFPKVESEYMGRFYDNKDEELKDSLRLHDFIASMISETICRSRVSPSVVPISIANTVVNGVISRGGCYSKLAKITDNYGNYLSQDVSQRVGRKIKVLLIHDGEAVALCFAERPKTVGIALGTAFGVGFSLETSFCISIKGTEVITDQRYYDR